MGDDVNWFIVPNCIIIIIILFIVLLSIVRLNILKMDLWKENNYLNNLQ